MDPVDPRIGRTGGPLNRAGNPLLAASGHCGSAVRSGRCSGERAQQFLQATGLQVSQRAARRLLTFLPQHQRGQQLGRICGWWFKSHARSLPVPL